MAVCHCNLSQITVKLLNLCIYLAQIRQLGCCTCFIREYLTLCLHALRFHLFLLLHWAHARTGEKKKSCFCGHLSSKEYAMPCLLSNMPGVNYWRATDLLDTVQAHYLVKPSIKINRQGSLTLRIIPNSLSKRGVVEGTHYTSTNSREKYIHNSTHSNLCDPPWDPN